MGWTVTFGKGRDRDEAGWVVEREGERKGVRDDGG